MHPSYNSFGLSLNMPLSSLNSGPWLARPQDYMGLPIPRDGYPFPSNIDGAIYTATFPGAHRGSPLEVPGQPQRTMQDQYGDAPFDSTLAFDNIPAPAGSQAPHDIGYAADVDSENIALEEMIAEYSRQLYETPSVSQQSATSAQPADDVTEGGDALAASPTVEATAIPETIASPEATAIPEKTASPETIASPKTTGSPETTGSSIMSMTFEDLELFMPDVLLEGHDDDSVDFGFDFLDSQEAVDGSAAGIDTASEQTDL